MIKITQQIDIRISHNYIKTYGINGLSLIEDNGNIITFRSFSQMAKYLCLTRQGLYNIIRKNMNPIDVLAEFTNTILK